MNKLLLFVFIPLAGCATPELPPLAQTGAQGGKIPAKYHSTQGAAKPNKACAKYVIVRVRLTNGQLVPANYCTRQRST